MTGLAAVVAVPVASATGRAVARDVSDLAASEAFAVCGQKRREQCDKLITKQLTITAEYNKRTVAAATKVGEVATTAATAGLRAVAAMCLRESLCECLSTCAVCGKSIETQSATSATRATNMHTSNVT